MNSKILTQISLVIIVLVISFVFYNKYFDFKNLSESTKTDENSTESPKSKIKGNIIKDIVYKSEDNEGNIYIIKSELGEINENEQDLIYMTEVTAIIKFTDESQVNLSSERAKYNTSNNDTNFFQNVIMNYLNHKVNADNLDIFFKDGKLEAYNNLVYRNVELNLIADKVEIDLITKNSKILMFKKKKIKIIKNK